MAVIGSSALESLDAGLDKLIRKARAGGADTHAVLARVTQSAVRNLAGVDHAGITVVEQGEVVRSLAATDGHALVLDNIVRRYLEGPGYDTAADRRPHFVEDLCLDRRWPTFAEKTAASTPIRSIIAVPVISDRYPHAALNFFGDTPGAFGEEIEAAAEIYARHLARLLTPRLRVDGSKRFDVVSKGKAALMQRFGVDSAAALSVLIQLAKDCNESLEDAAHRLIGTSPAVAPSATAAADPESLTEGAA